MSNHWKQYIKSEEEINIMRQNGKILADILNSLKKEIVVGVATLDIEKKFIKLCKKHGARPACKGYTPYGFPPFPTGLCLSINEESVHCYPKAGKILRVGDVVTIDTSIEKDGLYVDSCFSMGVGKVSEKRKKLLLVAEEAMNKAIDVVKEGIRVGDIGNMMHSVVKKSGYDVLRDYAGHGIGKRMHEYPTIPCYGVKGTGEVLMTGMTICIEALVCEGKPNIDYISNWETTMIDGKDWVQFEHTVLVKKDGYEILTIR